jgi:hypothetical protein
LILLSIREPRASTTLGERDATSNARSEEFEEAMKDAREIVEACKMMKVYHDDFAASSGLLHLANAVASVSVSSPTCSLINKLTRSPSRWSSACTYSGIHDPKFRRFVKQI